MKIIIVPGATDDVLWRFNNLPKRWVPKKNKKSYHPTMFCSLSSRQTSK
jgi:hypothetical protein